MVKKEDLLMCRAAAFHSAQALEALYEADKAHRPEIAAKPAEKERGTASRLQALRRWFGNGHARLSHSA